MATMGPDILEGWGPHNHRQLKGFADCATHGASAAISNTDSTKIYCPGTDAL